MIHLVPAAADARMTGKLDEPRRMAETLITLDGPGGVGKSTAATCH